MFAWLDITGTKRSLIRKIWTYYRPKSEQRQFKTSSLLSQHLQRFYIKEIMKDTFWNYFRCFWKKNCSLNKQYYLDFCTLTIHFSYSFLHSHPSIPNLFPASGPLAPPVSASMLGQMSMPPSGPGWWDSAFRLAKWSRSSGTLPELEHRECSQSMWWVFANVSRGSACLQTDPPTTHGQADKLAHSQIIKSDKQSYSEC